MEEETKKEVGKAYGKSDLKGLRVEHSTEKFKSGQAIILTLKDSGTNKTGLRSSVNEEFHKTMTSQILTISKIQLQNRTTVECRNPNVR